MADLTPRNISHFSGENEVPYYKGYTIRYQNDLDEKGVITYDLETTGLNPKENLEIAFIDGSIPNPFFKMTGTVTGRLDSSKPMNLSNQPRDKFNYEKELAKLTPEERKLVEDIVADYNRHTHRVAAGPTTPPVAQFIPTKENCGCSGRDLLHFGHKCGFFTN